MKKLAMVFLLALVATFFSSCSSEQDKLISRVEEMAKEKLIPNLKDPSSFEKKEILLDTISEKERIGEMMELDVMEMEHDLKIAEIWRGTDNVKAQEHLDKMAVTKKHLDSLSTVSKNTPDTSIFRIEISYVYRAKNGFGALDIHKSKFSYFPDEDKLTYQGSK